MQMRLQAKKVLPEIQLKTNLYLAAQRYSQYMGHDILIVYASFKDGPYGYYEFYAGIKHFQHLAGVKYPKGAENFFKKCYNNQIHLKDIVPVENIKTTSSKIEILPMAIDLRNAQIYKIGEKILELKMLILKWVSVMKKVLWG